MWSDLHWYDLFVWCDLHRWYDLYEWYDIIGSYDLNVLILPRMGGITSLGGMTSLWGMTSLYDMTSTGKEIILGMGSANERWHYISMSSLIGYAHNQNDPWGMFLSHGMSLIWDMIWQNILASQVISCPPWVECPLRRFLHMLDDLSYAGSPPLMAGDLSPLSMYCVRSLEQVS